MDVSYKKAVDRRKGRCDWEVAELLVDGGRHMGEFKFRHAARDLDQRPQQRPGKEMMSWIWGSGEKYFSLL